jgi:hypothetical protein
MVMGCGTDSRPLAPEMATEAGPGTTPDGSFALI